MQITFETPTSISLHECFMINVEHEAENSCREYICAMTMGHIEITNDNNRIKGV